MRQAAPATAALKSPAPTTGAVSEELPKRKSTKNIKTSVISSQYLVSSTTNVDATPIASPSMISLPSDSPNASLSTFSLKRLCTTLRSKQNVPEGDEIMPWIDPFHPSKLKEGCTYSTTASFPVKALWYGTPFFRAGLYL